MTRWVVVGGGSAGCVVATRLSECETNDVVLLEAGGVGDSYRPPGEPVLDVPEQLAVHAVSRRAGAAAEPYLVGRGLGGSSLVNAGVVVDPHHWSVGHDLPVAAVEAPGPVGAAVLAASSDAELVGLIAREGRRVTAADAYLAPAAGRASLTVRPGTEVSSIAFDGRRCVGVTTAAGEQVSADRVVVSAGAIGTPELLLRSGVDTPGVGRRLQDHAGVMIPFRVPHTADRPSPSISVTVERPGRQIVVLDAVHDHADGNGALLAGHLDVTSEGHVTVPDPDGPSEVVLRQLADRHDSDGLVRVVGEAFQLLESEPVRSVIGDGSFDTPAIGGDVSGWIAEQASLSGYHHLAGSCRLGAVLDADGWLRGYERLAVCDASALPGVPVRNPYLVVVLLAERMAAGWAT